MAITCTHDKLRLSPVFLGPRFEKSHVHFSTTLTLPESIKPLSWWYTIPFGCKERETEVNQMFDCMQNLFPSPTGWEVKTILSSSDEKKVFKHYCIENGRATVDYIRPNRGVEDYKGILKDMCEGYIIVHSYKTLSKGKEYFDTNIPFSKMKVRYDSECSTSILRNYDKPSFCYAEHKYNKNNQCFFYSLDCSDDIFKYDVINKSCDASPSPEYKIIAQDYSYNGLFARFAALSYKDKVDNELDQGWSYINYSSKDYTVHGFYGHAFTNDKMVVVAFRGTDNSPIEEIADLLEKDPEDKHIVTKDWLGSNICFETGCIPLQYDYALNYFKSIKELQGESYNYVVVGHSLGGGLAQLVSLAMNVKAVTFDSPGVLKPAKTLGLISSRNKEHYKIEPFMFEYNLVNVAGKHILNPVQVSTKMFLDCSNFISDTVRQHGMERGAGNFDKNTGQPFNSNIVDKDFLSIKHVFTTYHKKCKAEQSDFIKRISECAKTSFSTGNYHANQDELCVSSNKIVAHIYLPVLKKIASCKAIQHIENAAQFFSLYKRSLNDEYFQTEKENYLDKLLYDLPISLEKTKSSVGDLEIFDKSEDLNVFMFNVSLPLEGSSAQSYNIINSVDLRKEYHVIDCANNEESKCCGTLKLDEGILDL